jgi:alcohol dehydrogenase, propanol-preferring
MCQVSAPAARGRDSQQPKPVSCVLNGLSPGEFPVSIFDVVLNRYTVRGSIVGTRIDLEEALAFAAEGKAKATIEAQPLSSIDDVFERLKTGKVNGRVALGIGKQSSDEALRKVSTAALKTSSGAQNPKQLSRTVT